MPWFCLICFQSAFILNRIIINFEKILNPSQVTIQTKPITSVHDQFGFKLFQFFLFIFFSFFIRVAKASTRKKMKKKLFKKIKKIKKNCHFSVVGRLSPTGVHVSAGRPILAG